MPTASEAATMEAATMEAADTSDMGDAHTVRETATSKMSDMGDTDAATIHVAHAAHPVAEAMTEGAVVSVAAKYGGVAVIAAAPIAVIIPTQRAAINRIRRQPVRTGVGLGSSRLRSGERSRGQANGSSQ